MLENEDLGLHFEPQLISHITEGPTAEITTADFDKLYATSRLIHDGSRNYTLEVEISDSERKLIETRNARVVFKDKEWELTVDKNTNPLTNAVFENTLQWLSNTLGAKLKGKKNYIPWDKEIPDHLFVTFNREIHAVSDQEDVA